MLDWRVVPPLEVAVKVIGYVPVDVESNVADLQPAEVFLAAGHDGCVIPVISVVTS